MSLGRPLVWSFLVAGVAPDVLLDAGTELADGINLGRPAWHSDGACRLPEHQDVNFYPGRGESTEPAKAVCAVCPVRALCLAWALDHGEQHGVWGGLSERARRRLRGQRRREQIVGKLPTEERRRRVGELRAAGLSHRAIAERLGVGHRTVALDLRALEVEPAEPSAASAS